MPEGDSVRRAAERLRVLEGEVLAAEAPHPRARALRVAERVDGRRLERVEAVGKNLLLMFEGGLVLRSHLRMRGRWRVEPAGSVRAGKPWLVLRGREREAVLWNGPILELGPRILTGLGPDVMSEPPDLDEMVVRFRRTAQTREVGDALLDQRLVAGIGNMWKAEALFHSSTSPWLRLGEVSDEALRDLLVRAGEVMRTGERTRFVYRRAGRPCRRCSARIRAARQGEDARTAYWCPRCQAGTDEGRA